MSSVFFSVLKDGIIQRTGVCRQEDVGLQASELGEVACECDQDVHLGLIKWSSDRVRPVMNGDVLENSGPIVDEPIPFQDATMAFVYDIDTKEIVRKVLVHDPKLEVFVDIDESVITTDLVSAKNVIAIDTDPKTGLPILSDTPVAIEPVAIQVVQ